MPSPKHRLANYRLGLIAFFLSIIPGALVYGLPNDRHQPIHIESNQAERNEKLGTTIYQGKVIIRQGTILIRADKVTVFSDQQGVKKIVCLGQPAHYQQLPKIDSTLVLASGNTIEYHPTIDQIQLIDNASLEQDGTIITGERIDYDVTAEVLKAKSDNTGKTRIQMVIPPAMQANPTPNTTPEGNAPQGNSSQNDQSQNTSSPDTSSPDKPSTNIAPKDPVPQSSSLEEETP